MYLRPIHTSHSIPTLHSFIRENPLGIFTTALDAPPHAFIQASHIPWVLDVDVDDPGDLGTLRGHMARANPQAKAIIHTLNNNLNLNLITPPTSPSAPSILGSQIMILFNSPHQHYITPRFYTSTKPTTGKVVPTWNYAAVQVYGEARVYYRLDEEEEEEEEEGGEKTSRFLDAQVRDLTDQEEGKMGTDEQRWKVSDAPSSYVNTLKKGIIGIEVRIQSIAGKYKMSQELGSGDREGVVQGLGGLGELGELGELGGLGELGEERARKVAEMVKEWGGKS